MIETMIETDFDEIITITASACVVFKFTFVPL